jgi:tetratricopeptide (TPR) repeat protein
LSHHHFTHGDAAWAYTPDTLRQAWPRLHAGDALPWPDDIALVRAWIACHAGAFEEAADAGLALGLDGIAVANQACAVRADYLEADEARRAALYAAIAERAVRLQRERPDDPAGHYWHAYALSRQARSLPVVRAMAQGFGGAVADALTAALKLQPLHADAHIAYGRHHTEIIDRIGPVVGALTYGARREEAYKHFRAALEIHPQSVLARIEYARALIRLEGDRKMAESLALFEEAADVAPRDARERLDVEEAKKELPNDEA